MDKQEAIKYLIKPVATSTEIGEEKQKEFEAYNMAIEALSAERTGWIPVSERLPEELKDVLVCVTHEGKSIMVVSCRRDVTFWDGLGRNIKGKMAWMPLPEPYESEDE